mmetsp:Transcript_5635/g.34985  ORF Transcript_5635/g.34985 Transcript_5635/m.34985 type:complete len:499 (-) Transcript_5635:1557-3053(-)
MTSSHPWHVLLLTYVWPDEQASAAGARTCAVLKHLRGRGMRCTVGCAAKPDARSRHVLKAVDVDGARILPNRSERNRTMVEEWAPDVVVFDRYYAEEAWSHDVRMAAPGAMRILDTQDIHGLRANRQRMVAEGYTDVEDVLRARPNAQDAIMQRELAAIMRSDLTVVVSKAEKRFLERSCNVPREKLITAPFFRAHDRLPPLENLPNYRERRHFVAIGNWDHAPNADAAAWLVGTLWRRVRAALPSAMADAELHLYGARARGKASWLDEPRDGVRFKGYMESLEQLKNYRVMLSPLRFGAGVKGKVLDAWAYGLPVVTTPIGAEGTCQDLDHAIADALERPVPTASPTSTSTTTIGSRTPRSNFDDNARTTKHFQNQIVPLDTAMLDLNIADAKTEGWGGLWKASCASELARDAAALYSNPSLWTTTVAQGRHILEEEFSPRASQVALDTVLDTAMVSLERRRRHDYLGQMLWGQQYRATEYFSRWIELKEAGNQPPV